MSKGPDHVTNTTTSEPPAYLQPYLENAANYADQLFQTGGQQFYPGNTVVPFSPQTNQALNMQQNRAMQGSGVVDAAQGFTQNLLGGNSPLAGMAGGGSNPYLDATFDKAAGAVNRSMDTVLARSGRDLTGNLGARSDQLNNLATNIYGGAYENDANRRLSAASTLGSQQLAAAGQAIPLAREDYFDIGQLGQVGSAVEQQAGNIQQDRSNRFGFAQGAPYEALNSYIGALSGAPYGGSQSSSQPVFNNPLSSGLGGALSGASLGMMIPGLGAGWGAGLGGLLGLLSDRRTKENIRRVGQTDSGLPVYTYNYIGNPVTHMGVMADEAEEKFPEAVFDGEDGYKRVIYGRVH